MPLLSRAKRKVGRALGSAAMQADANRQSFAHFYRPSCWPVAAQRRLRAVVADPAAALIMVPIIAKEGIEGVQGKACDECSATVT